MSTLLKSWTWVEPSNIFDKTIELYTTHVLVNYGTTKHIEKFSFEDLLLSKNHTAPPVIEYEILKAIAQLPLQLSEMCKEAQLSYYFYQYVNNQSLLPDLYEKIQSKGLEYSSSIYLFPFGLEYKTNNVLHYTEPLHTFILNGPSKGNLLLEWRIKWTDMLLNALDTNSNFTKKDCFSLFDYDKIEAQHFEWSDIKIKRELNINKGYAIFSQEEYFDNFSIEISIENLWYMPEKIHPVFKAYLPEIFDNLSNAIVEKRRENWYDLITNLLNNK